MLCASYALDLFELGRAVTLDDIFELLLEFAFCTEADLHGALVYLQDGCASGPSRVMRLVEIIERLKSGE